jgi:hypothetical protein
MNKREFLTTGLAGLVGSMFGGTANAASPQSMQGIVVYTLDVGSLPPYKAEAFIDRLKDKLSKEKNVWGEGWGFVIQPVRPPQETKVEIFRINASDSEYTRVKGEILGGSELLKGAMPKFGQQEVYKDQVKDYVLMMLGAPVVKIELDDQQLDLCYEATVFDMNNYAVYKGLAGIEALPIVGHSILRDGALARAKIMLGRIRNQLAGSGRSLQREGRADYEMYKRRLRSL